MKDIKKAINKYITILNNDSKMFLKIDINADSPIYEELTKFNDMIQLKQLSFVDDDATPDEVIRIMNALNSVPYLVSPSVIGGGSHFMYEFKLALLDEIAKKYGYKNSEDEISQADYGNISMDYFKKLYGLLNSAKKMNKDYLMLKLQVDMEFMSFL